MTVDAECPRCRYEMNIELLDVRLERRVFCPACKVAIELRDDGASAHAAVASVDRALDELQRAIRGFAR